MHIVIPHMAKIDKVATEIEGLTLAKRTSPVPPISRIHEPSLAMNYSRQMHVIPGETSCWFTSPLSLLYRCSSPLTGFGNLLL